MQEFYTAHFKQYASWWIVLDMEENLHNLIGEIYRLHKPACTHNVKHIWGGTGEMAQSFQKS